MKRTKPHLFVLYTIVCALVLLAGCGTPSFQQSEAAYTHLTDLLKTANADGVITQSEAVALNEAQAVYFKALKADYEGAKGLDLVETLGAAAAVFVPGAAGIVAAINAYRNAREKKVWGTPEAPKA